MTVVIIVIIASFTIVMGILYQYFSEIQENQLREELHGIAIATEQLGTSYLENLNNDKYRITWIRQDGSVIFDNQIATKELDNHLKRKEIQEAIISGTGHSMRYSSTLTESTLYEAVKLNDGSILRLSISRASILVLVLGMMQPFFVVMVIAIILSIFLSRRMAKRVVAPINNLALDTTIENEVYEELAPFYQYIKNQQHQIQAQIRSLRQKQEEFDQITGNMREALVILDKSNCIVSINPAGKSLFNTDKSCIGEDVSAIDRSFLMHRAVDEAVKAGRASFSSDMGFKKYHFDLSRIDANGKRRGLVILGYDITEQSNAEKNRKEFTANVSHELKTPLQSIIGASELLKNDMVEESDVPRFLGHIHNEAERLVKLIDDIIRLSQIDENTNMEWENISLKKVSYEVKNYLADIAKKKNISVIIEGDEGTVYGVYRLIYEIIYNLCENAIKYNNEDGNVHIFITCNGEEVKFQISDNGIGISPEDQEKVFERFYRADKSHSKKIGGTGLGLSIVKHAVLYHSGKISLQSRLGEGTVIDILFPQRNLEIDRD